MVAPLTALCTCILQPQLAEVIKVITVGYRYTTCSRTLDKKDQIRSVNHQTAANFHRRRFTYYSAAVHSAVCSAVCSAVLDPLTNYVPSLISKMAMAIPTLYPRQYARQSPPLRDRLKL
ncbi:hypothetical protein F5B20DRAFT_46964 [Whalleya microplaca]|nr:hypothetical protein F5B20DRAFT_46964 [Whalleya microplaca]